MIKNKCAQMSIEKPVVLILVLLVIVAAALFVFKVDINGFLRNLPGFEASKQNEDVYIASVDEEIAKCQGAHLVAISKKQDDGLQIYFRKDPWGTDNFGEHTSLYIEKGKIMLGDSYPGTHVADIKDNGLIVATEDGKKFLNSNYERYISNLFKEKPEFNLNARQFDSLVGSRFLGGVFCKDNLAPNPEFVAEWPEESILIRPVLSNDVVQTWKYFFILSTKSYSTVKFDSFFTCAANSDCDKSKNFLFIDPSNGFQEIYYYISKDMKTFGPLFVIARDGSIWLNLDIPVEDMENITGFKFVDGKISLGPYFYEHYEKTNFKVTSS